QFLVEAVGVLAQAVGIDQQARHDEYITFLGTAGFVDIGKLHDQLSASAARRKALSCLSFSSSSSKVTISTSLELRRNSSKDFFRSSPSGVLPITRQQCTA